MKLLISAVIILFLTGCTSYPYNTRTWTKREVVDATGKNVCWMKETVITINRQVRYYPVYNPGAGTITQKERQAMLSDDAMDNCVKDFKPQLDNNQFLKSED